MGQMIEYLFGDLFRNPEGLFAAFGSYHEAVWPMQAIGYVLGIIVIFLGIKRIKHSDNIILLILSYFWLWTGIVFCLVFFAPDYPVFYGLGPLVAAEGILFLILGFRTFKLLPSITFKADMYGILGAVYILYALVIYPLIGCLTGHPYPDHPVFGIAPCPLCIFTFGILMWARKRIPVGILVIPLIESFVGIIPFVLGLYADIGLVLGGICGFFLILRKNKILPLYS
jgi:hypothetical protein